MARRQGAGPPAPRPRPAPSRTASTSCSPPRRKIPSSPFLRSRAPRQALHQGNRRWPHLDLKLEPRARALAGLGLGTSVVRTLPTLTRELGLQAPYAQRGIDYYIKNKVYAVNGDVTLAGLKVNIEVQAQDGVLKEPLPAPLGK